MVTMRIRPLDIACDFPALAVLLAVRDPEPPTPELLREWEGNAPAGLARQRLVAFDDELGETNSEVMVGFCDAASWPWESPHQFWISTVVAPDHRRRGLGAQLIDDALAFAREQGATRLAAEVRDNATGGLHFAERCGFRTDRHIFESRLHLADFNEQQFIGVVGHMEADDIRFLSLADLGDSDEARRKLYDINATLARDVPGHDGEFMPFEQFQKTVCSASWYRPDGQIVAVVDGTWVGMAAVGYFQNTNSMYNMFTGVDPAWRGRGIALALKLLAIACARRYGAAYISTNNDSENAPMLAINCRLGYQPEPGYYRMIREPAFG
jgi:GNAT superfamily N-acetyltransferase